MPFALFSLRKRHTPGIFADWHWKLSRFSISDLDARYVFLTVPLASVFTLGFPRKNYTPLYFSAIWDGESIALIFAH